MLRKVVCAVGHLVEEPHHTVVVFAGEGTGKGEVLVWTDCHGLG